MRQRKLPKRTRKKIHAYYSEVWVRQAGEWLCCPVMCNCLLVFLTGFLECGLVSTQQQVGDVALRPTTSVQEMAGVVSKYMDAVTPSKQGTPCHR